MPIRPRLSRRQHQLPLARIGRAELHREDIDLTSVARAIGDRLREAYPSREVELCVQDGLTLEGDAVLLGVVMENLLGNAWKFTSRGATARIEVGEASMDGQAAYFVRDDGAGFDMAHASRLFVAFQRMHTAEEFPGTGIGLATVQRIIRRHGGELWAESRVGKGATFFFTVGRRTHA